MFLSHLNVELTKLRELWGHETSNLVESHHCQDFASEKSVEHDQSFDRPVE
jgi:hypothetical protein